MNDDRARTEQLQALSALERETMWQRFRSGGGAIPISSAARIAHRRRVRTEANVR